MSIGDKVLFCIGLHPDGSPELRPAIVVRTWAGATYVNLQVFVDGTNDRLATYPNGHPIFSTPELQAGIAWKTSINPGLGIGEWRTHG